MLLLFLRDIYINEPQMGVFLWIGTTAFANIA